MISKKLLVAVIFAALILGGLFFPDVDAWRRILKFGDQISVVNVSGAEIHDVAIRISSGIESKVGSIPSGGSRTIVLQPQDSVSLELEFTIGGLKKVVDAGTISSSPEDRTLTVWTGGDTVLLTWGAQSSAMVLSAH